MPRVVAPTLLLAVVVAAAAPRALAVAEPLPSVNTTLTVSTSGKPVMTASVFVHVPAAWAVVKRLQGTSRFRHKTRYQRLVADLMGRLGVFDSTRAGDEVSGATISELRINGAAADIGLVWRGSFAYRNEVGPWGVEQEGRELRFFLRLDDPRLRVPWRVGAQLDRGAPIDTSTEGADKAAPGLRHWKFAAGTTVNEVRVEARPTDSVWAKLYTTDWVSYARGATGWLAALLVPLGVLAVARRERWRDARGTRYAHATTWAVRIAAAVAAVRIARFAVYTVDVGWLESWIRRHSSAEHWYYSFTAAQLAELVIATVAVVFLLSRLARLSARRASASSIAIGLVVLVVSVPLFLIDTPPGVLAYVPRDRRLLDAFAVVAVVILGTYALVLALRAVWYLADEVDFAVFPGTAWARTEARRWRPQLRLRWPSHFRRLGALLVAAAIVAYWLASRAIDYQRVATRIHEFRLSTELRYFPLELLGILDRFLWLLLLLCLLSVLAAAGAAAAREQSGPLLGTSRRTVAWSLALLLVGWTVGIGSDVYRFAFPLPAVVAALAIVYFTRPHLEARRDAITAANPPTDGWIPPAFGAEAFRLEMLSRARAISAARRYKQSLYARYRNRELSEDDYDGAYRAADREERAVRAGGLISAAAAGAPPATSVRARLATLMRGRALSPVIRKRFVVLPDGSPYSYALSLGPEETWWENGMLAAATAAVLAVVPVARYGYDYVWVGSGFGPLYAVTDFIFEWAKWIAAGLVFGCCYAYLPGRVGAIKAVALMGVLAVPVAVFALFPETHVPSRLGSNLLLVTLFLVVTGVILDWLALRQRKIDARHLRDFYELQNVKTVAALAPVTLAILAAANAIAAGNWHDAGALFRGVVDLVKGL